MNTLAETFRDVSRSVTRRPDEILLDVGAGGELVIARLRVVLTLILLSLPVVNLLADGRPGESLIGFAGAAFSFSLAQVWLALAKRSRRYRWLPFATAASDVTLTTLVLSVLASIEPSSGLNSQVVFSCYLLAIMITAMKNDGRVTLLTGTLALLQYAGLSATVLWVTPEARLASAEYGTISVGSQGQRLLLLLMATAMTAVLVYRMQRLVELSGIDGLTGLPNRSYLKLRVPHLIEEARTQGTSLSLALIDLDRFGRINEEYGHLAGDRALRHVVGRLRDAAGREAPLIRLGGEEFVLLLPGPIGAAWERMEHLRCEVQAHPFTAVPGNEPFELSFSAGLACFPQDAAELSGLLRRADLRLRLAKQAGRNRCVARE